MDMESMKTQNRNRLFAKPRCPNENGWADRHLMAVTLPNSDYEKAVVEMLSGWLRYADAVQSAWDSSIGNDYVLGPNWAQIGAGLRGLLNGELGRIDAGTLDSILCRTLETQGFDPDTL
jgi:hypothetical protein